MNTINQLVELLETEHALYGQLLSLLEGERHSLMMWDSTDIADKAREKEELSGKLKSMGETMRLLIGKIAIESGKSAAELTLAGIAENLEDRAMGKRLMATRARLLEVSAKAAELNNANRALISNAVDITKKCLKYMNRFAGSPDVDTYSGARLVEGRIRSGMMLTRTL
jgi:flagellar biosynthesis/type III secretory pathway chaperone